jgi:hypothetical protein
LESTPEMLDLGGFWWTLVDFGISSGSPHGWTDIVFTADEYPHVGDHEILWVAE